MTDRTSHAGEESDEGEHAGDVLVGGCGHDGHFGGDDTGASGEGDENLAHDEVAETGSRLAEMGEEADAEELEGEGDVEGEPFEAV